MKKEDFFIVIIGLLLLAAMLYTIFFGGDKSMHGVGDSYHEYRSEAAAHSHFC